MFRTFGLTMTCLAMFSIAGGHWAVLQTVAWTQMLASYTQETSLVMAVKNTFDGDHPCSMCLKVKEGQSQEEKAPATVKVDKKAEAFLMPLIVALKNPDSTKISYRSFTCNFTERFDAPPIPVPRTGLS